MINPVEALIDRWPAPKVANFGRDLGVTVEHASAFKRRKSIPINYWPALLEAAKKRGLEDVNSELLISIHAKAHQ